MLMLRSCCLIRQCVCSVCVCRVSEVIRSEDGVLSVRSSCVSRLHTAMQQLFQSLLLRLHHHRVMPHLVHSHATKRVSVHLHSHLYLRHGDYFHTGRTVTHLYNSSNLNYEHCVNGWRCEINHLHAILSLYSYTERYDKVVCCSCSSWERCGDGPDWWLKESITSVLVFCL